MIEKVINNFFDTLVDKTVCYIEPRYLSEAHRNELSIEIIKYKLNSHYRSFFNYILLIILSLLLRIPLLYIVVFMVPFNIITRYAFGFHFSHSMYCIPAGMFTGISSLILSMHMYFSLVQRISICVLLVVIYWLFAPSETKTRPIPKRHRKELKMKCLIIVMILMVLLQSLYMFEDLVVYGNLILFSIFYRGVYILPFTKIKEYYDERGR